MCLFLRHVQVIEVRYVVQKEVFLIFLLKLYLALHALHFKWLHLDLILLQYDFRNIIQYVM